MLAEGSICDGRLVHERKRKQHQYWTPPIAGLVRGTRSERAVIKTLQSLNLDGKQAAAVYCTSPAPQNRFGTLAITVIETRTRVQNLDGYNNTFVTRTCA